MTKKQGILTPANGVTFAGMILVIFSHYYIIVGEKTLAIILFLIAVASDWLDGFVARNKLIQRITGRGVSKLGKLLDPIRDTMIRAVVFILASISNICLIYPTIIATLTIFIFWFYNRKINRLAKEVRVSIYGKILHVIDCTLISLWIFYWVTKPEIINSTGFEILVILFITALARLIVYKKEYKKLNQHNSMAQEEKKQRVKVKGSPAYLIIIVIVGVLIAAGLIDTFWGTLVSLIR